MTSKLMGTPATRALSAKRPRDLGARWAERRGDAGQMQQLGTRDQRRIDIADVARRDSRRGPVVDHVSRSRWRAHVQVIDPDPPVIDPADVLIVHAMPSQLGGDARPERVARQHGCPGDSPAQAGQSDRHVRFRTADPDIERRGGLEPMSGGRRQPDHGLTKGDEIVVRQPPALSHVHSDSR